MKIMNILLEEKISTETKSLQKGNDTKERVSTKPGSPEEGNGYKKKISIKTEITGKIVSSFDKRLVTFFEPESLAAEKYAILKKNIVLSGITRAGNAKRVFLISSAIPGEGKTLSAVNLAISLAKGINETVLLIDADLRRPNISKMLGISKKRPGLTDFLTAGGNLADFLVKTSFPKMSVLPAGKIIRDPSELISSKNMSELIKEVKYRYDNRYIIIDSPPIIPVADARILASLVDGVILIIKAFSTPKNIVDEAINQLEEKDNIVGLVVNNCRDKKLNFAYKYKRYAF